MTDSRRAELTAAFVAYQKGIMSEEQLMIAYQATAEMVETMFAMGISGAPILGYIMQESSLRSIIDARKIDSARKLA